MAKGNNRAVSPELIDLLNRLSVQEGSFRNVATRAGVRSPDAFARVARGDGSFSDETARRLAETYGESEGFTLNQLRRWARLPIGDEPPTPKANALADLRDDIRFAYQEAAEHMPPEELDALLDVILLQFRTYTRSWVTRHRGETKYREGEG